MPIRQTDRQIDTYTFTKGERKAERGREGRKEGTKEWERERAPHNIHLYLKSPCIKFSHKATLVSHTAGRFSTI